MRVVEICLFVALGCVTLVTAWKFSSRIKRQDLGVSLINESIYKELHAKMNATLLALAPVAARSALYAGVKESLALAKTIEELNETATALARLEDEFAQKAAVYQSRNVKNEALTDLGARLLPRKDS